MTRKQRIIYGILIGSVILLTIIFIIVLIVKKPELSDKTIPDEKIVKEISQPTTEEQDEISDIVNNARGFIEIYFTYSNSSSFSNIKEVFSFMTKVFREKVDRNILKIETSNSNGRGKYFLKTTKVLSSDIKDEYKKNKAIVNIGAVERNIDDNNKEEIIERKYVVYMVKTDKWRIDDVKIVISNVEKSIFN